jgi:hypothetical protein
VLVEYSADARPHQHRYGMRSFFVTSRKRLRLAGAIAGTVAAVAAAIGTNYGWNRQ